LQKNVLNQALNLFEKPQFMQPKIRNHFLVFFSKSHLKIFLIYGQSAIFAVTEKRAEVSIDFFYNRLSFIILLCFGIALLIQLVYYWGVFRRLAFYKKHPKAKTDVELEPVSVVVCAKDAIEYLKDLVPMLLHQDYPDYEIVIVNDCSDDDTEEYLKDLERNEPKIKPVQLLQNLNFFSGKKFPLSMGIKSAQHDLLILTDADCLPSNDQWLRSMVNCYGKNTEIVLGYGPYEKLKGTLNRLIRFDTLHVAVQYFSLALSGNPYMGVGRNLSYRKSLFYKNKGFISHYNIPSGDDDLFISQVATKRNTEVCIDSVNRITSTPKQSFASWVRQKRRHCSTGLMYKPKTKALLGLYSVSQVLFYASFIALLFMQPAFALSLGSFYYIPVLAFLFLTRYISQMIIFNGVSNQLGEKGLMPGLIFYDFFFTIFTPLVGLCSQITKPKSW
jgi:Glycosyltransferases, probably involved in cell wall biogenesis